MTLILRKNLYLEDLDSAGQHQYLLRGLYSPTIVLGHIDRAIAAVDRNPLVAGLGLDLLHMDLHLPNIVSDNDDERGKKDHRSEQVDRFF